MIANLVNIREEVVVEKIVQGKALDKGGLAFRAYGCKEWKHDEVKAILNMLAVSSSFNGKYPSAN